MNFDYFDMLSGDPIFMPGVGHLFSPKLKQLCPAKGIGYHMYNVYLNFLSWGKEEILKYDKALGCTVVDKLSNEIFTKFDVITLLPSTREFYREILSFFMLEEIVWDENENKFITRAKEDTASVVGSINRDNFSSVECSILQLNYLELDKNNVAPKFTSTKARDLWEKAQSFLKKQAKESSEDTPAYHLSNIISKICVVHPSYNLFNIYDLTVFQVYDTFIQIGFIRNRDLNEEIYSNHGGKDFKFEDWLQPILKNV